MSQTIPAHDTLAAWCEEAARAAGDHALGHHPRRTEIAERFAHDIKLKLDHECQAVASASILRRHADAIIVGEEGGSKPGATIGLEWIIDPIDGTVNFFHGIPWWCASVAVRIGGTTLAGAVYAPESGAMFAACLNGGATVNGKPIQVSAVQTLADALAITGSEKELEPGRPPLYGAQRLAPSVQKIRILGAAALDLCQVACGHADLFFQNGLYLWDIAAAGLIVQEAGGFFAAGDNGIPGRYRVTAAAHASLANEAIRVLQQPG